METLLLEESRFLRLKKGHKQRMAIKGEIHVTVNDVERVISLTAPRFTVGRDVKNALSLRQPGVSRYHAEIIRLGKDFLLRDLGSTNGSYVNGTRTSEQLLNDGDVLRFGRSGPEALFRSVDHSQALEPERHEPGTTENLIKSLSRKLEPLKDAREDVNLRCVLAEAYLSKGEHEAALKALSNYIDAETLSHLPVPSRATVLYWLGRVYVEQKQYAQAIDVLRQSLELHEQVGDDSGTAGVYAALGRAFTGTEDLLSARDNMHRALLTARRAGNARLIAEVHLLLGKIDWKETDLEGARYNWTRAARLAEGTSDPLLRARIQHQQAFILYSEGKLSESVPLFQSVVEQVEAIGNVPLLLKVYSSLSRALVRLGAWAATERLLEDRLRFARDYSLPKAEAVALTDLAELRVFQGNLNAASNVIQAALKRHGATVYARTQRILGRVLLAKGEGQEAIEAFVTGLQAAQKKGSLEEQILLGQELALAYNEVGDTTKAREQIDATEAVISLDPALDLMARVLYARALILIATDQYGEANRYLTQSLSIFETVGDQFRTGLCQAAIGDLRSRMGRGQSARAHLEEAKQIFIKLGASGELQRVESQLRSGAFDGVVPAMTTNLPPPGLTLVAPLSMAFTPSPGVDEDATHPPAPKVLVAEADEELATILIRGLEVENYQVDHVQDGRAALERAVSSAFTYDVLILDALLEYYSGFDICRELRKGNLETQIILLGSRQGVEDKIEALQSGADDFISKKNMVFEELLAKIDALLR